VFEPGTGTASSGTTRIVLSAITLGAWTPSSDDFPRFPVHTTSLIYDLEMSDSRTIMGRRKMALA
jgi:hypothetical protein